MRFDLPNLRWETFKVLVRTHVVEFRGITKTNLMFCEFFFLFKELSWKIEGIIEWNFLHLLRCETCLPSSETRLE